MFRAFAFSDLAIDYVLGNLASRNRYRPADYGDVNGCAILVLPHRFNVQALSLKTPARVFVRLSRKFFRNDEFVNETPAGFLLGKAENPGELRIDLQDSIMCVEQNDRLWHFGKKSAKQGFLANRFGNGARVYPFWRELSSALIRPIQRAGIGWGNAYRAN